MPSKTLKKHVVDQDVMTLSLERVRHVYELFDHVAVMFSGGKDSTALLNITLQVAEELDRLPLRVIHIDEEAIPYDVEDYLRRMMADARIQMEWYCIPVKHRNACSADDPYWYPWAPEDKDLWVRPMPPEAITELPGYDYQDPANRLTIPEIAGLFFPPELGRCCQMLGIRADESMTRRNAVSHRTEENYIVEHKSGYGGTGKPLSYSNIWKAYPIYDWTTPDVWTAPAIFGWDYCRYYDVLEMAGISHHQQRLAPPFGEEPFQRLWAYARTYPELWEKMVMRVPGANTGALYSRTELYSYGEYPEKPVDLTWQEFIAKLIRENHSGEKRRLVAERIKREIQAHKKKTKDPILAEVGHPDTGLSWKWLTMIAVRGDFKNRKQALTKRQPVEKYREALAAFHADTDDPTRF